MPALRSTSTPNRNEPEAKEQPARHPQVVAQADQEVDLTGRVADRVERQLESRRRDAALTRMAVALTRPKAANAPAATASTDRKSR